MTYDALRIGRVSIPGQVYFITMVTAGRRTLFADFGLARVVIREMRRLDEDGWLASMAWVVMPDHVHWLIQLGREVSLARAMQAFKGRVGQRINGMRRQSGPVWQKSFHDRAMRTEDDLPDIARYIVANPLRAGLVIRLGDYPHWDAVWLQATG